MATYCITAANHKNRKNHVASQFYVWLLGSDNSLTSLGGRSADFVVSLLVKGHKVLSARDEDNTIYIGAPIEVELRIAENETKYPISDMPTF